MSTQIAKRLPTLPGLLPDAEVLQLAESFKVVEETPGVREIDRLPTMPERHVMSKRLEAVDRALAPISADLPTITEGGQETTERRAAAQMLGQMFMGWQLNSKEAAEKVSAFLLHLGGKPLFAIKAACDDAGNRRLRKPNGDPVDWTFPPTSTMLGAAAERHASLLFREKLTLQKALHTTKLLPPPPSEEDRTKMQGLLDGLAESLRAGADTERMERESQTARVNAEQSHRMLEAAWLAEGYEPLPGKDGVLHSPSLLKRNHAWPPKGAKKIQRRA